MVRSGMAEEEWFGLYCNGRDRKPIGMERHGRIGEGS